MALAARVKPTPARNTPPTRERKAEGNTGNMSRVEDRLDYLTVRAARVLAAKRGETPMAWEDFKRKITQ